MATPTVGTFTGNTNGSVTTFDYTQEFSTLNGYLLSISTSLTVIEGLLELFFGPGGATVPGTLSNSASQMMKGSADHMKLASTTMENLNKLLPAIQNLSTQMAAVSSTISQGVATQQISVANQIQKNKFDQTATQAALQRNGLPTVEVTSSDLVSTIQANVQSALEVAASANATGLVTGVATTAVSKATSYVTGLLPTVSELKEYLPKMELFNTTDVKTTAAAVEARASAVLMKTGTLV